MCAFYDSQTSFKKKKKKQLPLMGFSKGRKMIIIHTWTRRPSSLRGCGVEQLPVYRLQPPDPDRQPCNKNHHIMWLIIQHCWGERMWQAGWMGRCLPTPRTVCGCVWEKSEDETKWKRKSEISRLTCFSGEDGETRKFSLWRRVDEL